MSFQDARHAAVDSCREGLRVRVALGKHEAGAFGTPLAPSTIAHGVRRSPLVASCYLTTPPAPAGHQRQERTIPLRTKPAA